MRTSPLVSCVSISTSVFKSSFLQYAKNDKSLSSFIILRFLLFRIAKEDREGDKRCPREAKYTNIYPMYLSIHSIG